MELRALVDVALLAIHVILVAVVLRRAHESQEHGTFLLSAAILALWATGRFVTAVGPSALGSALALVIVFAMPFLLLRLAGASPGAVESEKPASRSDATLLCGFVAAAAALACLLLLASFPSLSRLNPLSAALLAVYTVAPTFFLRDRIPWRSRDPSRPPAGRQARAAACVLLAGVGWMFLGRAFGFRSPRIDLVAALAAEVVLLIGIRSGAVKIEPLTGGILATVVQSVAAAAILLIGLALANRMRGTRIEPLQAILLIGAAFVAASLLVLSRSWMEGWLERALFPERSKLRRLAEEVARERDGLRRRLAETERLALVGEIAASVAHEIKNPLGPIKGFAQMIAEDLESPDRPLDRDVLKRRVAVIVEEVEKIDERVRRLLDQARVKAEEPRLADPGEIARRALLLVEGEAERSGKRVRLMPSLAAAGLPPVFVQPIAFEGALVNLLLNALEAVGDGGEIEVETRAAEGDPGGVAIVIRDDGCGIPAERLPRIFDPFTSGQKDGVGLGLGIARRAVESAGGRIEIESTEGKGTEVRIFLPGSGNRGERGVTP